MDAAGTTENDGTFEPKYTATTITTLQYESSLHSTMPQEVTFESYSGSNKR
jgi:hypothetical protein